MEIKEISVDDLRVYSNNPRNNDNAVDIVAESIKEFGFKVPIVVDKNNVIVAGHTRLRAAKKLGLEKVPCIVADDLSDEQIRAFRLVDNKASEYSSWDFEQLELELVELENAIDMSQFGFFDESDLDIKPEQKKEKMYEKMELKAFEHYDYLVFVFDNQMDFLNVVQRFGVHKVDAGYSKRKLGIGRVIKGAKLVETIRDKDSDTVEGKSE